MKFTAIRETCIYIEDIAATRQFYHEKLGLEIISAVEGRHIFFRAGTSVLLCFIAAATRRETGLPPHGASGSIHFALEVKSEDYDLTLEAISKKEIKIIHRELWPNGRRSFYFHDPGRNLVEVLEEGLWD